MSISDGQRNAMIATIAIVAGLLAGVAGWLSAGALWDEVACEPRATRNGDGSVTILCPDLRTIAVLTTADGVTVACSGCIEDTGDRPAPPSDHDGPWSQPTTE